MQNKMKKTKKGFTLVELMVVLAILGILAAIAIPKYNQVKAQAAVEADINTANTIIHAARMQVLLNDEKETEVTGSGDTLVITDDNVANLKYLESTPNVQSGSGSYTLGVSSGKFTITFTSKHTVNQDGKITAINPTTGTTITITEGSGITAPTE